MSQILDFLYLGGCDTARDLKKLQYLKISHILNTAAEIENYFPTKFVYSKLDFEDNSEFDLKDSLHKAADFIQQAKKENGTVFVHCMFGVSRSSTAVLAYLIKYMRWSYSKALKYVVAKREQVCPNDGFVKQLKKLAQELNSLQSVNSQGKKETFEEKVVEKQEIAEKTAEISQKTAPSNKVNTEIIPQQSDTVLFKCKTCRFTLFDETQINHQGKTCGCIFLEKIPWMEIIESNQTKLHCPQCKQKLGDITLSGNKCSCGVWVNPAFQVQKSKIDECQPLKCNKLQKN